MYNSLNLFKLVKKLILKKPFVFNQLYTYIGKVKSDIFCKLLKRTPYVHYFGLA